MGLAEFFFSVVIPRDGFARLNATLMDHHYPLWNVVSKAVAGAEAKDP